MSLAILIVEDDRNFRKLLEMRLRAWRKDLEISVAENLAQARDLLEQENNNIALVILDQHLPDGLGSLLIEHPRLAECAVLAVSADNAPDLPGKAVRAGAHHFLGKHQISEPLFIPLLEALLDRKQLESEVIKSQLQQSRMQTIKVLLATLQHEINNPLGAVFGAAYILKTSGNLASEQTQALRLIEESGKRIKHVLKELCDAAELEEVTKGYEQLFHVPGDPEWKANKNKDKK